MATAAEPIPRVWRNARRVTEVRGELFSDAGRASEPGCWLLFMRWRMSPDGTASRANPQGSRCLWLSPISPTETLALPFGRVLRALLSTVEPKTPPDKTNCQHRQPLAKASCREEHCHHPPRRRHIPSIYSSVLCSPAVWGVVPMTDASIDGLRSRVRLRGRCERMIQRPFELSTRTEHDEEQSPEPPPVS